jgi:branched-chain amino acid transport system permease protein
MIDRLRNLDARAAVLIAILLALLILPAAGDLYLTKLLTRFLIYALAALSLDLILGYGGMVSFGHAMFLGIGMYVTGILFHHGIVSAFIAWPAAIAATAVFALIVGALALRTSGVYFIMVTLAFGQMLYFFGVGLAPYGGDDGMPMPGRNTLGGLIDLGNHKTFYYFVLAVLLAVLYFAHRLVNARFGMAILGINSNERRMRALGFPTFRYKLTCFVIAAVIAGIAGIFIANQNNFISPGVMHWTQSGDLMVMVILGGAGSLFGAVVGALAYLIVAGVLSSFTQHWLAVFGPALLLIVLFGRRGLYGALPTKPLFGRRARPPAAAPAA